MDQEWPAGRRLFGEDLKSEFLVAVEDVQRVIEITADDEVLFGSGEDVGSLEDLDEGCVQGDRVIASEIAIGLEAEDLLEFEGRIERAVDIGEPVGGKSKAPVVSLQIGPIQEAVGIGDCGDPLPAHGLDEAILLGSVPPFDSPLGLGTVGIDNLNAQARHCSDEVGHDATFSIENGPPVNVEAPGEPVALTVGPEGPHTVCGVLTCGKTHEGPAYGIVDEMEEGALRATTLEPVMIGAIKLDKLSNGGSAGPLGTMGPLAPLDIGAAIGHEPPPYGLVVNEDLVILEQDLRKQRRPIVPILRLPVQLQDLSFEPFAIPSVGGGSAQPVDEATVSFRSKTSQQPVQVSLTQSILEAATMVRVLAQTCFSTCARSRSAWVMVRTVGFMGLTIY